MFKSRYEYWEQVEIKLHERPLGLYSFTLYGWEVKPHYDGEQSHKVVIGSSMLRWSVGKELAFKRARRKARSLLADIKSSNKRNKDAAFQRRLQKEKKRVKESELSEVIE